MKTKLIGISMCAAFGAALLFAETDYPSREKVVTKKLEVIGQKASARVDGDATVHGVVTVVQTLTATKGNITITPTNDFIVITGHSGVVTAALAVARSGISREITIVNAVGTNVVFSEPGHVFVTTGYTAITNGQCDIIRFRSYGTNWLMTGRQDN